MAFVTFNLDFEDGFRYWISQAICTVPFCCSDRGRSCLRESPICGELPLDSFNVAVIKITSRKGWMRGGMPPLRHGCCCNMRNGVGQMNAALGAEGLDASSESGGLARRIRRIVCYNQGEIIQYQFLASEYHRELKEFLKANTLPLDDERRQYLAGLMQRLEGFLNEFMAAVVLSNFSLLDEYFKERGAENCPHYSLFMPYRDDGAEVVGLFRWPQQTIHASGKLTRKLVSENTGFSEVIRAGKAYFSNNLPEEVYFGRYINKRINEEEVERFRRDFDCAALDGNWESVWSGYDEVNSRSQRCYKSTVIIPVTMMKNDLCEEFIKRFRIRHLNRLIFGYLCLDHLDTGYFRKVDDVEVGYIVADLISLFVVYRYVFSRLSRAFNQSLALTSDLTKP